MDRGVVRFSFGGIERNVRVEIAIAPAIEEATGTGLVLLFRQLMDGSAKLSHASSIIRIALANSGTDVSDAEILKCVDISGIMPTHVIAAKIVGELFKTPPSNKGVGGKRQPAVTTDAAG